MLAGMTGFPSAAFRFAFLAPVFPEARADHPGRATVLRPLGGHSLRLQPAAMKLGKLAIILFGTSVVANALGLVLIEPWVMHPMADVAPGKRLLGYASLLTSPALCLWCSIVIGHRRGWFARQTLWNSGLPCLAVVAAFALSWLITAWAGVMLGSRIALALWFGEFF